MPGTGRWTSDDASLEARLPGPLRQFLELYGASRFWSSHEALEEAWRRNGSDFYQGLWTTANPPVQVVSGAQEDGN